MGKRTAFILCLAILVCATAEGADWRLHGGTADEKRYSPLTKINLENVSELGLAGEFDDFVVRGKTHRGNQATPLVVDGIMYITGPWSVVYALDAVSGKLIWQYDPEVPGNWARRACCDAVNRGVAFWQNKIYLGTLDGYLVALDAASGKKIWKMDTLTDRTKAYTITGAPRLAGKNIIIGNGGGELGVRGYVSAYDLATGALAWRFFTVPAKDDVSDVRKTWSDETLWDYGGGGTVWDSMTYDEELDRIYVGVGNGSPWPAWVRSPGGGDNLYLSSILALDGATGKLAWHYQTTPADSWDYTATQHMILADLEMNGAIRKVIMQAPKNGFFYVLDRESGALISAKKYTFVTWASRVDLQTGRPVLREQGNYAKSPKTIWPSMSGGHNWQPMTFSEETGLVYIPVLETPVKFYTDAADSFAQNSINVAASVDMNPPSEDEYPMLDTYRGRFNSILKAYDPVRQKIVWSALPRPWWGGGVLSTAGGLVFQGGSDGFFIAYGAKDGKLLKEIFTGTAIMAPPVTYEVDGVQYVAVLGGLGGSLKEYPSHSVALKYENRERLFIFRIGGGAVSLPNIREEDILQPPHPQAIFDRKTAAQGRVLFNKHCSRCHAIAGVANNYPNLWNLPPQTYDDFDEIILEGALSYAGMPAFDDVLDTNNVRAIREYILADEYRARH